MPINIQLRNDHFHLVAENESGNELHMDGTPAIGGLNLGFRPMEALLASLGGCSAIDVLSILRKQKQTITSFEISLDGERRKDILPAIYSSITVHFIIKGEVEVEKLERAIKLTEEKYCSVYHMLKQASTIKYTYSLNS